MAGKKKKAMIKEFKIKVIEDRKKVAKKAKEKVKVEAIDCMAKQKDLKWQMIAKVGSELWGACIPTYPFHITKPSL